MIIQKGKTILREIAHPVEGTEARKVIKRMKKTLSGCDHGVALAAPQIGKSLRIFIVAGKIFKKEETDPEVPDLVFINPEIVELSKEKEWFDEGCLSVEGHYGKIERSKNTTVRAFDESGEEFEYKASGFLSEIFQHEIDHLNGILFSDTAIEVKDVREENE